MSFAEDSSLFPIDPEIERTFLRRRRENREQGSEIRSEERRVGKECRL